MKRIQSNQGFTLVELIVVITILAILGTIGFISLQGYSAQSRDSKRASDMRALNTAVNVTNTNGIGLLNLIVQDTTRELAYASTNVGGTLLTSTTYEAGRIDFGVINQNWGAFKDPATGGEYSVGGTTRGGGAFQIAARMEGGGIQTAVLQWNYAPRNPIFTAITALTAANVASNSFNIAAADTRKLRIGDTITVGAAVVTVAAISSDGLTITTTSAPLVVGSTTITYTQDNAGLIRATAGTGLGNVIIDKSTTTLPY